MADNATCSFGAKLSFGTYDVANPETPAASYTEFGQLIDTAFPELVVAIMKASRLNQTDRYKRKRPGWVDAGNVPAQIHYNKADYATLKAYVDAGTEIWVKVEAPEGDDATHTSKCQFHGFVCKLGQSIQDPDSDSGMISSVEFAVNGKPQFAAYGA